MGIYEVIVSQRYFNQTVLNRYHYVSSGTPAAVQPSYGLLYAMGYITSRLSGGAFPNGTLARTIQVIQSATTAYISAYARNLYSVTDFYENPWPTPPVGTQADEGLSPASAFAFSCSRVRTDIRRGMKRYVGMTEANVNGGGVIGGGIQASLASAASELGRTITYDDEGNTLTFIPCVLGLEQYTTPSGRTAYRPYATESAQLDHIAQGGNWSPYTTLRTQVSRQYGRGV